MKPSVIVWDLETVPDLAGFAAAHDLVGKSDVEVREAIGDKFPRRQDQGARGLLRDRRSQHLPAVAAVRTISRHIEPE